MKNLKFNSVIILLISSVFMYIVLKDNFAKSMKLLFESNLFWILAAIGLFVIHVFLEAVAMHLITKQHHKKYPFWKMFRLQGMTKFFNGITPFSSGGQPLQVYELTKGGLPPAKATNVIVEYFILFQIAVVSMGTISTILNYIFNFYKYVPALRYFYMFGYIVNFILLIIVFMASVNIEKNKRMAIWINNVLYKIKIVKNKEKNQKKLDKFFSDYFAGFQKLKNNKKLMFKVVLVLIACLSVYFLIPQLVFNALNIPHQLNIFTSIITGVYIFIMSSFVPIPGAAGGVELGFVSFFANFVPKKLLPPALIIWRFITFYLPTLVGGIIYNFFGDRHLSSKKTVK